MTCHTMACVQQHANDFYGRLFAGLDHFARWLNTGQPAKPGTNDDITNMLVPALTLTFWTVAAVATWAAVGCWLCRGWLAGLLPRIVIPGYGKGSS